MLVCCFRRGLKAVFMLIPLFGLQLFLTIYRPPMGAPGERGYELFQLIVGSSQGVFVSLIFCFFNGEVSIGYYLLQVKLLLILIVA